MIFSLHNIKMLSNPHVKVSVSLSRINNITIISPHKFALFFCLEDFS